MVGSISQRPGRDRQCPPEFWSHHSGGHQHRSDRGGQLRHSRAPAGACYGFNRNECVWRRSSELRRHASQSLLPRRLRCPDAVVGDSLRMSSPGLTSRSRRRSRASRGDVGLPLRGAELSRQVLPRSRSVGKTRPRDRESRGACTMYGIGSTSLDFRLGKI
jgi:hypothetical protein